MTPPLSPPDGASSTSERHDDDRFDVREYARTARGSHRDDPAVTGLEGQTVEAEAVHLIRVLRDLERATMERMRNLLVTATHKDGRITGFLTTWAFEKFWIADALDSALDLLGEDRDGPTKDGRPRRTRVERTARRGPIMRAVIGNVRGAQVVASQMASGLVDEWISQAAFRRLARVADQLSGLAHLALEVKERHVQFFLEETHRRLTEVEASRRAARKELNRSAWPLAAIDRPASDRSFFEATVFGDEEGRREAQSIAERIAALPGLAPVASTVTARLAP